MLWISFQNFFHRARQACNNLQTQHKIGVCEGHISKIGVGMMSQIQRGQLILVFSIDTNVNILDSHCFEGWCVDTTAQ